MPVQIGGVVCPKCGEDRVTLVTEVIDPMGKRWFCSVCACEFRQSSERSSTSRDTMKA
jgi:transposase-like protein